MVRAFDSSDHEPTFAVFSPDGRYILTAGSRNWWRPWRSYREAVLWESATGKRVQTYRGPKDVIRALSFSDDGQRLRVDYKQGWATNWDMGAGKPVDQVRQRRTRKGKDRYEELPDEYKSADGRWTVGRAPSSRNDVVLADARTSKTTMILDYGSYEPIRVAFGPRSRRIAVADEDSVHVFDPEMGKELATFVSAYGGREWLVTTPDGHFQGSRGGRTLIRWRVGEAEYSFERFEKQRCRPDLVAQTLQENPTP
jgi:WD40 repeat protein